MAAFLVDYENVSAHVGLKGAEFLNESDRELLKSFSMYQNINQRQEENYI